MSKQKKHILTFSQEYNFNMIGICSHHNDYRLAWGLNERFSLHLEKSEQDYPVIGKKNNYLSRHSLYEFKDNENLIEYYLVKNKSQGNFLIPEQPSIDFFLFLFENYTINPDEFIVDLRTIPSVLTGFVFDPQEFDSTENIVFN
jgi:hypothetical protein